MLRLQELPKGYKQCKTCDKPFRFTSGIQKFCYDCSIYNCKNCGKEYRKSPGVGKSTNYCSKKCFDVYRTGKPGSPQKLSPSERKRRSTSMKSRWQGADRDDLIAKIREGMNTPEVRARLIAAGSKPKGPMSQAGKRVRSRALEGKQPSNYHEMQKENKYGSKFGWLELGGQRHYMRSSWERNVARYLEWLKGLGEIKAWDYECKRFIFEKIQFGNRTYLPDFKVIENNDAYYWIEVKGYMNQASKTKLKRMAKYYPEEKIQLIDGEQYAELKKELKNLIVDWE